MPLLSLRHARRSYEGLTFNNTVAVDTYAEFARFCRAIYRSLLILGFLGEHLAVSRRLQEPGLKSIVEKRPQLPFKYLRRNYLAAGLSVAQKSAILAYHYEYLARHFSHEALAALDHDGIALWQAPALLYRHEIRLCLPDLVDTEGELALHYLYNSQVIQCLSFTFAPSQIWADDVSAVTLVSRLQAVIDDPAVLRAVAKDLGDISPKFALAAALQGVALALKQERLFAVGVLNHITLSRRPRCSASNSYDEFFRGLGGIERPDGFFELPLPYPEKDLSHLSSQHRKRARKRRAERQIIVDESRYATSRLSIH